MEAEIGMAIRCHLGASRKSTCFWSAENALRAVAALGLEGDKGRRMTVNLHDSPDPVTESTAACRHLVAARRELPSLNRSLISEGGATGVNPTAHVMAGRHNRMVVLLDGLMCSHRRTID